MNDRSGKIIKISGITLFLLGVACVFYFIWSPLFTAEFQSDTAEMLMWAQQILEKHTLISPDFSYSYTIPFGGQLILVPFVKILADRGRGLSLLPLRLGMSVIALIFLAAIFLFFRELFGKDHAFAGSGVLVLFLCGVRSLRELFWAHMVFYSLSVLYFLVITVLMKKIVSETRAGGAAKWLVVFCLLLNVLACTSGAPLLIYFAVPFLCSMIVCFFRDRVSLRDREREAARSGILLIVSMALSMAAGFAVSMLFHGDPLDNYTDYYTVLSASGQWAENLSRFPMRWIGLFTELSEETIPVLSMQGIRIGLLIVTALTVLGLDLAAMFRLKDLRPLERFVVIYHWVLSLIILFFFWFGTISNYERRLIPVFVTGIISALIMIRHLLQNADPLRKVRGGLAGLLVCAAAVIAGISVFLIVPDNSFWYAEDSVMQTLLRNDLTYGYSTDFWFANGITVMTGEKVRVREVGFTDEGKLIQKKNQTDVNWYRDVPGQEKYFLICQEWFVSDFPEYLENAEEVHHCELTHPVSGKYMGYLILVYDHNLIGE